MAELTPAICPRCGADLQLPKNIKKALCMYCGGEIIIELKKPDIHQHFTQVAGGFCPKCQNVTDKDNRLVVCQVCGEQFCQICKDSIRKRNVYWLKVDSNRPICEDCYNELPLKCDVCEGSGKCTYSVSNYSHGNQIYQKYSHCPNGKCPGCNGGGGGFIFKCETCGGSGICPHCNGDNKCRSCEGRGYKTKSE